MGRNEIKPIRQKWKGTISEVRIVERGGYIPFCDHRCPPDVNPEDYLFYLNLKEEMFGQIK